MLNSTGIFGDQRVKIFGYNVHEKNKYQEGQSGIAIAVRSNISHQLLDDFTEDVLAIKVSTVRGDVIIGTTYLPFRRPEFPRADLMKIIRKRIPVYILADFNAKHREFGHLVSNECGNALSALTARGLLKFMGPDFPTYFSGNATGKPDLLFGNSYAHLNYALERGDLTSSDHWPVRLTLSTLPIIINCPPRDDIKNANWGSFKVSLEREVEGVRGGDEERKDKAYVDRKINRWFEAIAQAKRESIPLTSRRTLPHPIESDELKLLQWQFDGVARRAQHLGWTLELLALSKDLQRRLTAECIQLFEENWERLVAAIEIDRKNPDKFWAKVKRLLGSSNEKAAYILNENNEKVYSDEGREEIFRSKWSVIFSITPEENRRFDAENDRRVTDFIENNRDRVEPYELVDLTRLDPNNALTKPVTTQDIKSILRNFKNKAPGLSKVNKKIMTEMPTSMIDVFSEATNETLSMGYFPDFYKRGLITFLGKQGKTLTDAQNYRPISLLEIPGKIVEKIIQNRLLKFLWDNNLVNPNQYGFTKGRGTQTCLAKLYETIAIAQKSRHPCNVVSRDISKAFDKVWHDGLKYKMCHANFPDILLRVLCSFMDDRCAVIKIGNLVGEEFPLLSGVPQGAILSPTLFNFYTFDMPGPSPHCGQYIFADDHTQVVTHEGRSKRILAHRTAREVQRMSNYENEWKIASNPDKFQLLSISAKQPHPVVIDGTIIPFRRQLKVLGLTLCSSGLRPHLTSRLAVGRTHLKRLKRFRIASTKTNLHLFSALVLSRMEYPTVLLPLMSRTNIQKFQAVQNTALRRAFKQTPPYLNTVEDLHRRAGLEPLNVRFHRLGERTWEKLAISDYELVARSSELNHDDALRRDHNWWRRVSPIYEGDPPEPSFRR